MEPAASKSVASLVKVAVADLQMLANATGVTIEIQATDPNLRSEVEPQFLALSLRNLLENAINYSPPGAKVTCHIERNGTGVLVAVEDEGVGIPEAELPRVTEKFFRGRNKLSAGSGLGLAIAQIAVSRLGGTLRLENRKPHGLIATLCLPPSGGAQA